MGLQGWEELRNPRSLQEGCAHFPWRRTRQGPQSMSSPHTSSPLLQLSLCLLSAAPPISKGLCPQIHSPPPTPPILQPFQKGKCGGVPGRWGQVSPTPSSHPALLWTLGDSVQPVSAPPASAPSSPKQIPEGFSQGGQLCTDTGDSLDFHTL